MARYRTDAIKRWALPDRTFFGHGACHILAGMFLRLYPDAGFKAKRIIPKSDYPGGYIFVSNDIISFDYHGYCLEQRLLTHHCKCWSAIHPQWHAETVLVDFDLLDTRSLNQHKMRGPDQYWRDVMPRARRYLEKIDHPRALHKAQLLLA